MSFARYPSYKDSGVEWLGEVPGHWQIDRLKRSTLSAKNGVWGDEAQQNDNDIRCVRVADFDRQSLCVQLNVPTIRNVIESDRVGRVLTQGDLLLEKSGGGEGQPVGCVVLYDDPLPAVCSNFVALVITAPDMDSSFWRYVHAAAYAVRINTRSIKQTSGIQNLDASQYFDERAGFPPLPEQTQIAAFLDRETAKIDGLVAEQRRLMALLKEKRQAVISHAVTQGLNPLAPMKPSGIEWLGDVPGHWEVCSIRRIVTTIEQGWSPECFSRPAENEEWGVLKAGCVNRGLYDQNDNKALPAELAPMPEYEVQIGDVLMSRASGSPELVGSTALVTSTRAKLMLSDKIFRLRFDQRMEPKFFVAALNSRLLRSQIEQALSGGNGLANNLPQASLLGFFLALPPMQEQQDVCNYIESELTKFDTLTAQAQRAIDLLAERRTALISAAVTGQIDVRGAF